MILIASKYLVPKGYTAIALFPFVFIRYEHLKENAVMLNHERIHLRQQAELLILPFYIWYLADFIAGKLKYSDSRAAYHSICFEKEAYANERNPEYLKHRPFWRFLYYRRPKN
ncbi:MAG: hypothetical protein EOO45_04385 [Flavobacterium sp.]|nr:MAG: hypothetical protein EOO45_04385 [Flavobacterium sp.]